jgi:thymidylate synthase (FAD)
MLEVAVLDTNCYVRLIEHWGSDERIIEAARMSTDKGFQGWQSESLWHCCQCGYEMIVPHNDSSQPVEHEPLTKRVMMLGPGELLHLPQRHKMAYVSGHNGDEKLLRYLYTHKHMTPFEMAGVTIEVQAPIFVFREWHRHRTQSYNELSARYTELPNLFYVPSAARIMAAKQSTMNKQSSEAATFTQLEIAEIQSGIKRTYEYARDSYEGMLRLGVAREVARVVIPVAQISRMRASANLRNWLGFLTLRMDPAAQWEIRQFANALGLLLEKLYPRTWELFQANK